MRADRYIKGILTVIAAALVWIAVALTHLPRASAAVTATVRDTSPGTPQPVNIVAVAGETIPTQAFFKNHGAVPVFIAKEK